MVKQIRILDLVESASSYGDGEVVYRKLLEEIDAGHEVTVSFEGIGSVPSAFINAAFIKLLETHTFEEVRSLLRIRNSTRHINELVKSRFEFVSGAARTAPRAERQQPRPGDTYRAKDGTVFTVRDVIPVPAIGQDEYEVIVASEQDVRQGRAGQHLSDVEFDKLLAEKGMRFVG